MRENLEDIARLDVIDNGKPIWEARLDMETVIGSLEYYGGLAAAWNGKTTLNAGQVAGECHEIMTFAVS